MLSEHEHYYGLGVDALVIVCSRNTSVTRVWAWMRDSMLSEHERYYGLGMVALFFGMLSERERSYGLVRDS